MEDLRRKKDQLTIDSLIQSCKCLIAAQELMNDRLTELEEKVDALIAESELKSCEK